MANLQNALQQLKEERNQAERQVTSLNEAISALEGIVGGSSGNGRRGGRVVSSLARQRMAAAQRARWARVRGASGVSTKRSSGGRRRRTLSAAARNKIAAAQRARWARFRAKQQKAAA
jgi:hypothetical protein